MKVFWPYLAALAALFPTGLVRAQSPESPAPTPSPATSPATTPDGPDPAVAPASAPLPSPPPPRAEPAPLEPTPLGRPKIDLTVPEPPAPVVRKMHNHDGFYLRASVGLGWMRSSVTTDSTAHPNYSLRGGGLAIDLLVGGTPSPGLALGGGLLLQGFNDSSVDADGAGQVGSGTGGLTLLGVFVDGFPMPNHGLHFGGLLGLAGAGTTRKDNHDEFNGGGLGMAAWVGQGFWVGKEWSLGGMLRLSGAMMREDDNAVVLANTTYGITLLFTVLYH